MNMTYWTFETERAIERRAVNDHLNSMASGIEDLVALVRKDIGLLDRCTIEALIVLDVHNKDVVQSLCDKKVEKIVDFEWQS